MSFNFKMIVKWSEDDKKMIVTVSSWLQDDCEMIKRWLCDEYKMILRWS